MSDTTTTVVDAGTSTEQGSQAEDQATITAAEASQTETHTDPGSGSESEASAAADNQYDENGEINLTWLAKNKGVDTSDPKAVAEAWRKAEQEFHKSNQKRTTVAKAVSQDEQVQEIDQASDTDPRITVLERSQAELQFFLDHADEIPVKERNSARAELIAAAKEHPLLAAEFALDTLWAIAKSQRSPQTEAAAEARGRKAEREAIERKSGAAIPDGNARGSQAGKADDFLAGFNRK